MEYMYRNTRAGQLTDDCYLIRRVIIDYGFRNDSSSIVHLEIWTFPNYRCQWPIFLSLRRVRQKPPRPASELYPGRQDSKYWSYNWYQHTYTLVDLSGVLVYEGNDKLFTSDDLWPLKNIYFILYYHNI